MVRVLIIHRNRLFREGLSLVLAHQPDITVLSGFGDVRDLLGQIEGLRPDVVLLDLSFPGVDALRDARELREVSPEVKILMLGVTESEPEILACIEAGVAGYVTREAALNDLITAIRAVAAGEALCSPKVVGLLFSRIARAAEERKRLRNLDIAHLTRREFEVITLIEQGLGNKEIAVHLQIEVQTVKNHVHNILEKLQLDNRRDAAEFVREHGLLQTAR